MDSLPELKKLIDSITPQVSAAIVTSIVTCFIAMLTTFTNILLHLSNKRMSFKIETIKNDLSKYSANLQSQDSQKNRQSSYISEKRIVWINDLKKLLSEYLSGIESLGNHSVNSYSSDFENINLLTNKIKLHLNYKGKADLSLLSQIYLINRDIERIICLELHDLKRFNELGFEHSIDCNIRLKSVEEFYSQILKYTSQDFLKPAEDFAPQYYYGQLKNVEHVIRLRCKLIVIFAETYLKAEWERIKNEVTSGLSDAPFFDEKYAVLISDRTSEIMDIASRINELTGI